ncbi:hypothetical protein NC653_003464 [Populus alba x Populus x berolinensis]|uniref:Uncharacterized protein n=1 Tax=Populus alba x Populus x berolinensis TaxID=444605 RepID=A0AAD6RSP2_9ROSI|nr:hypothetical protein NC653_003464 [Populus alba x Populus x berolinensis]
MSKGKELGSEDGIGDVSRNDPDLSKKRMLAEDSGNSSWITSNSPPMKKNGVCEISRGGSSNGRVGSSNVKPQDADYSYAPQLSDELENLILARVPRSEYWKFPNVNKRILSLVKSGELFKIRREIGVRESSVFIFATGDKSWWGFDRQFCSRRKLPDLPADCCFSFGDKESLCAGTHLIISGREIEGFAGLTPQLIRENEFSTNHENVTWIALKVLAKLLQECKGNINSSKSALKIAS